MLIDTHMHYTRHAWLDVLWSPTLRRTAALWPRLQLQAGVMTGPDAILAALTNRAIDRAIISPELSVAPGPQIAGGAAAALTMTRQMNDATAEMVARAPQRLAGLAVINPFGDAHDLDELRRAIVGLGLRGVLVGASYGGQGLDSPAARPFLAQVATLEAPLVLHPTVDGPYAATRDFGLDLLVGMPAGLAAAATRLLAANIFAEFPSLNIVLTHLGGGIAALAPWMDANAAGLPQSFAQRLRRFYIDLATASPGATHAAVDIFGPDHLLYGSDWPLSASANPADNPSDPAATLSRLPLGTEGRAAILGGTAQQIFGL